MASFALIKNCRTSRKILMFTQIKSGIKTKTNECDVLSNEFTTRSAVGAKFPWILASWIFHYHEPRGALMSLLPDTQKCELGMRRECRGRFPRHRLQRKRLVSDPGMHPSTCVTHVSWCMSGSLTRGSGAFPAHAQLAILCIWWEAHWAKRHTHVFWLCDYQLVPKLHVVDV